MQVPELIVILGATACGKTKLAANLAYDIDAEIISADSRQVYQQLDIGTGKDYDAYVVNHTPIKYHLIDVIEPNKRYHISRFKTDFSEAFNTLTLANKKPILCGGTGLYIESVLRDLTYTEIPVDAVLRTKLNNYSLEELQKKFKQLDKTAYHNLADLSTHKRCIRAIEIATHLLTQSFKPIALPSFTKILFGINIPVDERCKRIKQRLQQRIEQGLIEEVEMLHQQLGTEQMLYFGLEYKFITEYIVGKFKRDEMIEKLEIAIIQFAKRQSTYFRKLERNGHTINWIDGKLSTTQQIAIIKNMLYK